MGEEKKIKEVRQIALPSPRYSRQGISSSSWTILQKRSQENLDISRTSLTDTQIDLRNKQTQAIRLKK